MPFWFAVGCRCCVDDERIVRILRAKNCLTADNLHSIYNPCVKYVNSQETVSRVVLGCAFRGGNKAPDWTQGPTF